jgi:nucleoside-diphosphate-sugar epimerase
MRLSSYQVCVSVALAFAAQQLTGANGYIAMHVINNLLKAGYRVRGTVRAGSKVQHIRDTFKDAGDRLEVVIVEDITKVRPSIFRRI